MTTESNDHVHLPVIAQPPQPRPSARLLAPTQAWSEEFTLTGVTCGGCASKVTDAVSQVHAVERVEVDVVRSSLTVHATTPVDRAQIASAVEAAGYGLR